MHVYFLPLSSAEWTPEDTILLSYVSPKRRARVLRYVHTADQRLSLYAALLTRMALQIHTSLTREELLFCCTENHKPKLAMDSAIDFSFSHTRNAVLCCLSDSHPVGADIEPCAKAPYPIMDRVFHPIEIQYIREAEERQKQERFFQIWTQKEAYTKQRGTGLACELTSINTLAKPLAASLYSWQEDGYVCSVCGSFSNPPVPKRVSAADVFRFFTK